MYCVKCKQKTESRNIEEIISKNNRRMLKSICSICGSKKCQFVKNTIGKGIGDSITNAIGKLGELHLPATKGEYVPNGSFNNLQKYSYCGPGTKYEQRNKEGYQELMNWIVCANYMISFIMKILTLKVEILVIQL